MGLLDIFFEDIMVHAAENEINDHEGDNGEGLYSCGYSACDAGLRNSLSNEGWCRYMLF